MRILPTSLALAALLPAALAGQARYSATFGLTGGTRLAKDRIFQTISVAQARAMRGGFHPGAVGLPEKP